MDMNGATHLGWTRNRCRACKPSIQNCNTNSKVRINFVMVISKNEWSPRFKSLGHMAIDSSYPLCEVFESP
ncbi:protein of unknown function [Nitrospina watsonii]|uniref:Uncharacterized protein n=1 Tax=Nitrospina watsonii TaxID=1323948 RepID=A0ABM9HD43_9BACT|nr:protein of unknown function [Nitrospina watsonii]